ncbi:MAG: site-specific integrase [Proteobacteria bacterium]|nr:site-specific integrase [Pseudomonadota bacterium]
MKFEIESKQTLEILPQSIGYQEARFAKNESIWSKLGEITVEQALGKWLAGLTENTHINYLTGFKKLVEKELIDPLQSIQAFSLINHESIIDEIKLISDWSEATRQARAAAYISFTGFLQRRTQGIVRKAVANKEGANKTFFKVRDKVTTNALNPTQTRKFLQELENINPRDALVAKLMLQGGKRKTEVLALEVKDIDFENKQIAFVQSKTRGQLKRTVINYPDHVLQELQDYVKDRNGLVFVTRNSKPIAVNQIDRNFKIAGVRAGITFKVSPHVLRVTLVTRLKELKVQDTDIMKITGHANPAQLASYDKSDLADNASLYHHFV